MDELGAFRAVGVKPSPNVCKFLKIYTMGFQGKSVFCKRKRSSRWQLHGKIRHEISVLRLLFIGALKANIEAQGKT